MKTLTVGTDKNSYKIHIGGGMLSNADSILASVFCGKKAVIVTDDNVGPLYADALIKSLENYEILLITVKSGEKSKSITELTRLYEAFAEISLSRNDLIIALGGGVIGDLTGFAAATYKRGVPYVQIPTTYLAQVDSSVGGKCGVNLDCGKNMAGAFYRPKAVIADTDTLKTLNKKDLSSGMAEVIKYGAIADKELFERLENSHGNLTESENEEIIYTCCDIKRRIVEEDEYDTGIRAILNFGHSFGHATEKYYNYEKYTHGQAVSIGMVTACEFGEKKGYTKEGTTKRLVELLKAYGLPTFDDADKEKLLRLIRNDKKAENDKLNMVIITEIGKAKCVPVSLRELKD